MPQALRSRTLDIAHQGHQGIVKTKQLLRSKVRWAGIDKDAEKLIVDCLACQATGRAMSPTPVQMSKLPTLPWRSLHLDFCGPFPTGEMLFVVIDEYSRFPEVDIMRSANAQAVIISLERIFATQGLPEKITSDKDPPPFQSKEFNDFMKMKGIIHHKVTALWQQANVLVESFMKPLTKAVRSARLEGRDWRPALYPFLLNYRCAPHSTTGVSPAELFYNRSYLFAMEYLPMTLQTTSPRTSTEKQPPWVSSARLIKMKEYADRTRRVQESTLKVSQ